MRLQVAFCSILLLAGGCHGRQQPAEENVAANGPADIETLPPDESDSTPTNELENGVDQPESNDLTLND